VSRTDNCLDSSHFPLDHMDSCVEHDPVSA